jgi:hypothetical protein
LARLSWLPTVSGSGRATLLTSALRLSYLTIAWNGVVGTAALVVSVLDVSLALAGSH